MSNDDNVRQQAETFFNNSKNQPNELCVSLLEAIIKSPQQEVREKMIHLICDVYVCLCCFMFVYALLILFYF